MATTATTITRPVHPCVLTHQDGNSNNAAEVSCWIQLRSGPTPDPHHQHQHSALQPHLITACGQHISLYRVTTTGRLVWRQSYSVAGNVIFMAAVSSSHASEDDVLALGWARDGGASSGPRLSVVRVEHDALPVLSLVDLAPALLPQHTVLDAESDPHWCYDATHHVCGAVLGNGLAVAVLEMEHVKSKSRWRQQRARIGSGGGTGGPDKNNHYWITYEPYILPLHALAPQLASYNAASSTTTTQAAAAAANTNATPVMTGWGEIVAGTFLAGYLEPVLVVLHSPPGGRVWSGRLGRRADDDNDNDAVAAPATMYMTAVSVAVRHQRAAILWSTAVCGDASQLVSLPSSTSSASSLDRNNNDADLLVVAANSFAIFKAGQVQQIVATNGWAHTTCPTSLRLHLRPNPLLKLSVQLDAANLVVLAPHVVVVALSYGALYVLQRTVETWTLLPTGQKLSAIGQVSSLSALPSAPWLMDTVLDKTNNYSTKHVTTGLVFAASRLGDSQLLGYALENIRMPMAAIALTPRTEHEHWRPIHAVQMDADTERMLQSEEEALYAPVTTRTTATAKTATDTHVVPADEDGMTDQMVASVTALRALTAVDVLAHAGPLTAPCTGPVGPPPPFFLVTTSNVTAAAATTDDAPPPVAGTPALVHACGYGSSGGIAVTTSPGRDDRAILGETDCLNVAGMFGLPAMGLLVLAMKHGGCLILRIDDKDSAQVNEVDLDEWCGNDFMETDDPLNARAVFRLAIFGATELDASTFALLVGRMSSDGMPTYYAVILKVRDDRLVVRGQYQVDAGAGDFLASASPFVAATQVEPSLGRMCVLTWASGTANVVTISPDGYAQTVAVPEPRNDTVVSMDTGDDDDDARAFYAESTISAADVFVTLESRINVPRDAGVQYLAAPQAQNGGDDSKDWNRLTVPELKAELAERGLTVKGKKADLMAALEEDDRQRKVAASTMNGANVSDASDEAAFDEIDADLYNPGPQYSSFCAAPPVNTYVSSNSRPGLFVAIARQSGKLELFHFVPATNALILCWSCQHCACGTSTLTASGESRLPRALVSIRELRFFHCGVSDDSIAQPLYLSMETNAGDLFCYRSNVELVGDTRQLMLQRHKLPEIGRSSQEAYKHHAKLARKGMFKTKDDSEPQEAAFFAHNNLYGFTNVFGYGGLFAAVARPIWIVSDQHGRPVAVSHRLRHAAPAGAALRPVRGFAAFGAVDPQHSLNSTAASHFILHERVGRVGSQRLTAFRALALNKSVSTVTNGCLLDKTVLGVTVRELCFVDDPTVSSPDHPLYVALVSRELELDQSALNDDGLSLEERQARANEKELMRVKRQVEADLGGFDVESEWVEEIERDDCFAIDSSLGGAPPLRATYYSVWVLDTAANWEVIDTFDLEENEHGLTMQLLKLTDFPPDGASANGSDDDADASTLSRRTFVAVGTGALDHNGEDVGSRGRVLLLDLKLRSLSVYSASMSLVYEKPILHGPVTNLSCLEADGMARIMIAAGADINVEQWSNADGKLTQVGFFRATMQIRAVQHFKTFLLLSDAYDTLHFLVWREFDKSLTLLAKDYDPMAVVAAGVVSRGAAMTFCANDERSNLQFFQYAPGEAAARGGNRLVCRADFHLGAQVVNFGTHYCLSSLLVHSATPKSTLAALKQQDAVFGRADDEQRLGVVFGTTDGTTGAVVPLSEPTYWRMTALQSMLANAVESNAGLCPRAWRLYRRSAHRGGCRGHERRKNVIDGDLVMNYAQLDLAMQEDIASAIGSTVDLILDNLVDLQCSSALC